MSNDEFYINDVDTSAMCAIEKVLNKGGVRNDKARAKIVSNVVWSS